MALRTHPAQNELEALREKIKPLQGGFDLVDDHVVITDEDGMILYVNKAAERNTGYSLQEALGKNPGDLWGGTMPKEFYDRMWRTIKTERRPFVAEVQNKRRDGSLYWQELHISPVLDRKGEVRFFIGIEPNITDRKEKERFREEFISIVGHQLRNPLLSIRWAIELLSRSAQLSEKDKKDLGDIYRENLNLADFVGDLLVLSRVGAAKPAEDVFDLVFEVEKLIAEVKTHHPRVEVSFRRVGENFSLITNRSLAVQVFSNILYNAAEYSDKAVGKVTVVLEKTVSYYRFSCENNGLPIPENDQSKIFSKLFRASNAAKIKEKGTGLGLFLVKMICDSFGWKVSFKSPVHEGGVGTIFFVSIPIVAKL